MRLPCPALPCPARAASVPLPPSRGKERRAERRTAEEAASVALGHGTVTDMGHKVSPSLLPSFHHSCLPARLPRPTLALPFDSGRGREAVVALLPSSLIVVRVPSRV